MRALGFSDARDVDLDHVFREFDEDGDGEIRRLELDKRLRKFAGVLAEQRHALRRTAGGVRGAALPSTTRLDSRAGSKPIPEQLRESLAANCARVMDLFRAWDEDGNGLVSANRLDHSCRHSPAKSVPCRLSPFTPFLAISLPRSHAPSSSRAWRLWALSYRLRTLGASSTTLMRMAADRSITTSSIGW